MISKRTTVHKLNISNNYEYIDSPFDILIKIKKNMEKQLATSSYLSFFEKVARAHPLIYIFLRSLVRFTKIFEKDFDGVKLLNFKGSVNVIDVALVME